MGPPGYRDGRHAMGDDQRLRELLSRGRPEGARARRPEIWQMADRKAADPVSVKSGNGSAKSAPGRVGASAWKRGYLPCSR
jgi:hypothetical protein